MSTNATDDRLYSWINGKSTHGDGGRSIEVVDPWRGEIAARLVCPSDAELERAVAVARDAFHAHLHDTRASRIAWLRQAADRLEAEAGALVALCVRHIGKPTKAAAFEVGRSAAFVRACAAHIPEMWGESVPLDVTPAGAGRLGFSERVPHGVVLGVTPFNAPINLLVQKVAPALGTGNAIIVKPAPEGAEIALRVAALFEEAGLPKGLFQVVLGDAKEALALAAHPGVALVTLTGGTAAGEALARAGGAKPFLGELGGNSANIVCADADIADAAARIAPSAFEASGQQCISTQRIIVEKAVEQDFTAALLERMATLKVGDPADRTTDVGPVVHTRSADRIMGMIEAAVQAGATLLSAPNRDACLIHPTLIANPPRDSRVVREEIFGPVASIMVVADFDEAVAVANDCEFGLQAACFTRDLEKAFRAGRVLRAGSVWINEASRFRLDNYPFGGFGKSGSGREGIRYAMDEMTTWKFLGIRLPAAC